MEDVTCSIVIIHPLEAADHRGHPLQLGKIGEFEACRKFWPTAEQNAQRTICRSGEQLRKISCNVAAKPLSAVDYKYRRPNPLVALQSRAKPGRP